MVSRKNLAQRAASRATAVHGPYAAPTDREARGASFGNSGEHAPLKQGGKSHPYGSGRMTYGIRSYGRKGMLAGGVQNVSKAFQSPRFEKAGALFRRLAGRIRRAFRRVTVRAGEIEQHD